MYDRKMTAGKREDVQERERERERLQPDSVSGSLEWHTAAESVSAPLRSMLSFLLLGRENNREILYYSQTGRWKVRYILAVGLDIALSCVTWCIPYYLHPQKQELCHCAEMKEKKPRAAEKKISDS